MRITEKDLLSLGIDPFYTNNRHRTLADTINMIYKNRGMDRVIEELDFEGQKDGDIDNFKILKIVKILKSLGP